MDEPAAHELGPDPIDEIPRQPAVARVGHEACELLEPLGRRLCAVDRPELLEWPAGGGESASRLVAAEELEGVRGHHRREIVGLLKLPAVDEAVVAARALEIDPQERLPDVLRELDRHGLARIDLTAPHDPVDEAARGVGGGHELADEPVVGNVVDEGPVEPGGDLLAATGDEAGAGVVVAEKIVPKRHPVLGASEIVVEKFLDLSLALAGVSVGAERFDSRWGRQEADEIEADAAEERGVVAARRRRHPLRFLVGIDDPIDRMEAAVVGRWQFHLTETQGGFVGVARKRKAILPRRLGVDPACEDRDRLRRQRFPFARHAEVGIGARDPADQFAPGGIAGHEARRA